MVQPRVKLKKKKLTAKMDQMLNYVSHILVCKSEKKCKNNSCLFKDYCTLGIRLRILHTLFQFILIILHVSLYLTPTLARRSLYYFSCQKITRLGGPTLVNF